MTRRTWLAAAAALSAFTGCGRKRDDGHITGVGTLEVVEVDIAPMVAARVERIWVDEGAVVRAGDTIATLSQATLRSDIAGRRARAASAEAALRDLTAGARPAELDRARAQLEGAEAEATRTTSDLARLTPLAASQNVSEQQLDAARSAAATATSRRDAAREALRLLQQGARPAQVQAAQAEVASARAAVASGEAVANDLVLIAPVNGTVIARHVEPGETVAAGTPTVTLGETRRPWARIFVDQRALPLVQVGQPADAVLDAFPDRRFAGRVVAVSDHAEFTPRVALTEDERADLLFAVKVEFADSTGMLKAGLPATVTIRPALIADSPAGGARP